MKNRIDETFSSQKRIKIMTHVVAGYPNMDACRDLVISMAKTGVDLIEIQIPFSDPLADGHTIMMANQQALENGTTPADCFNMALELSGEISIPLLFMTYANIPFRMGIHNFIERSTKSGISGLIIPDLPFDEENDNYFEGSRKARLHPILLLSPDVSIRRLKQAVSHASGFIYSTLKVGITGARTAVQPEGLSFLKNIRAHSSLPVAAGFGISSPDHVKTLVGKADCAIIGSHIINLFTGKGMAAVEDFLHQCISV